MIAAASAYHWLVVNGLWTGTIFAATGVTTTAILGWLFAKAKGIHPIKLWKEHVQAQQQIANALDTSTPGGLEAVVQTLQKEKT